VAAVLTRARLRSTRVRHRIPQLLPTARPRAIRRPLRAAQLAAAQIRRVVHRTRAIRLQAADRGVRRQVTRLRAAVLEVRRQATRPRAAVRVRRQAADRARRRAVRRQAADRAQQRVVRLRADVREQQGAVPRTPAGATWVAAHLLAGMFLSKVEDRQTFVPMGQSGRSIAVACTSSMECGAAARW